MPCSWHRAHLTSRHAKIALRLEGVQTYYDQGHGFVECSRRFGFCHTAWIKAIKRGALRVEPSRFSDRRRRYDWAEVQAYYDQDNSVTASVGLSSVSAQPRGTRLSSAAKFKTRPTGMPIAELLSSPKRSRAHVKKRLVSADCCENRCQACGIDAWFGRAA